MNAHRFIALVVLALVPALGCSIGSVVVNVEEGGSGQVEFSTLKLDEIKNPPEIKGATHERSSSYTIERRSYDFADISSVSFEALTFERSVESGTARLDVTVPVQADARWLQQLDVTEERIRELKKRLEQVSDRLSEREAPMDLDPDDALKLKFEINVPETLQDIEVDAPDLDDHEWVSDRNTKNRADTDDQLVIDIPLRAVFDEEVKNLSLLLRYPASADNGDPDGDDEESEEEIQTY